MTSGQGSKARAGMELALEQVPPGPHVINQVGQSVLDLIKSALLEHCQTKGEPLAEAEISSILDRISQSSVLFPVYVEQYKRSREQIQAYPDWRASPEDFAAYVMLLYCHRTITTIFTSNAHSGDPNWKLVFAKGLANVVKAKVFEDIITKTFRRYSMLSAQDPKALTPDLLADDAEMQKLVKLPLQVLTKKIANDEIKSDAVEDIINKTISDHYKISGSSPRLVNSLNIDKFFDRLPTMIRN